MGFAKGASSSSPVQRRQAVLEFLEKTRVGKMPGLTLLGVEEEESDLEKIEMWLDGDEPGSEGDEGRPGPP